MFPVRNIITVNTTATATVPTQPESTYKWAVLGGVLSGGQSTRQIQFTSAGLGTVQITWIVTNAAGDSANGQKSVTVIDLPPAVQYTPAAYTITRGKPVAPIHLVSTGGAPISWTISPGLLPGLSFDATTGQITGTPSTLAAPVTYTVTAPTRAAPRPPTSPSLPWTRLPPWPTFLRPSTSCPWPSVRSQVR